MKRSVLPLSYYQNEDVLNISRDLLGKHLYTCIEGVVTGGIIVETEAYRAPNDRASHAFGNKKTPRNTAMFEAGGIAYVYLCYGIHHLFNIVTHKKNVPHAVLIRAIEPVEGVEVMLERRAKKQVQRALTAGPGTLTKALGIDVCFNTLPLTGPRVWLQEGETLPDDQVVTSPRVGVDYAGEDALLPWRFRNRNSRWTSPAK